MKKAFTLLLLVFLAIISIIQAQTPVGPALQGFDAEQSPDGPLKMECNIDQQWDVEYTFSAQAASCQAVVSDGYHFYLTYWNGNGQFDKFDMYGTFIQSFTIAEAPAIRDFAYDGEYFYGAPNGGLTIAQLDLENQMVVSTIPISTSAGVTGSRHLAYDPELDGGNGGFWLGQWSELAAVDMSGNTIYPNSQTPYVANCYGSAYDPWTDPGSPKLWLFTQNSGASPNDLVMLEEFDINTRSFTGFTLDLYTMMDEIPGYIPGTWGNNTVAGGAFYYYDGCTNAVLALNIQQSPNLVVGLELASTSPQFIQDVGVYSIVEPVNGVYQGNEKSVTLIIRNFGLGTQTENIPWEVSWSGPTGTGTISGVWTGILEMGNNVSLTLNETVDMSVFGEYIFEACTQLPGDENPDNDCKTKPVTIIVDQTWYAYLAEDTSGSLVEGPVEFNPSTPGGIVQLTPTSSDEIITGACWAAGYWWGCQEGGGIYTIDTEFGYMTFVGDGPALNGLAFGGMNIFYGVSDTELFEIDPATGQGTLIDDMGNAGGQMMGIACNMSGDLFGFDTGDDMFYSIDKTTGAATAIGQLGFDFEGPQDMAIDKNTGQCYITGYTTTGGLYSADVTTGAATLLGEFPAGMRLTGFAVPSTSSPPVGPPPQGFNAVFIEDIGVECSWGMYTPNEYWLGYDDGLNAGGIGTSGGEFSAAIRWDAIDLMPYNGFTITTFQFFPLKNANSSDITFKIWEDTNASFLIYEQVLENLNWNEWNTILLDEPQTIDASKELWVGFEVASPDGEDPIGRDGGPAIAGYGDMISFDGITWESLSYNYGLDFNYNLQILVEQESALQSITSVKSKNPAERIMPGRLEFLGVNIYRNGELVNLDPVQPPEVEYTDPFFEPGTYIYTAKAVYDEGLSDPTPGIEVVIPGYPEISISTDSLSEVHENPPQITTQEFTITNTGDEPLEWEIEIDFGNSKTKSQNVETKEYKRLLGGSLNNDVGIWSIVEPASGVYLGNAEPVTITLRNFGVLTQTEIPWEVSYSGPTGAGTFTGTWTGNLESFESVDYTLTETVDMSMFGDYEFEACTQLPGDENPDNDCKFKSVFCHYQEYCDASTTTEDEWIANVTCGNINNSSGWQGGVADYTDISTYIPAGDSEAISITNGNAWSSDIVTIWVDWNMDYEFGVGTNEEFFTTNVGGTGETFEGEITVPPGTPNGAYRMRVRMTYSSAPEPCGNSSYGEVEDYTIVVGDGDTWLNISVENGTIGIGDSETITATFNSDGLDNGTYSGIIKVLSNDPVNPTVDVLVTLVVDGEPPVISWNPDSFEFALGEDEEETLELEVSNIGAGMLECTMSITYGAASSHVAPQPQHENLISPDLLGLASTGMETSSPNVSEDEVIRYDDGVNNDAIAAGGNFEVSAYWPAATMSQYSGMELTHVEVYINDLPDPFVLKIYDAGTPTVPGALLHEETVSVAALNWNLIELSEPVEITGDDIWIGYEVTHAAGEFPAGCDAGPAVAGFGDMISLDGVTFEPMSGLGFNYNWNIAVILTGMPTIDWLEIYPFSGSIPGGESAIFDVTASTYDFPGPMDEIYYASIWMENNDPENPLIQIPVEIVPFFEGFEEGENGAAYIMMFPNPTKEIVNISTNYEMNQVAVLDQAGQVLLEKAISGKSFQLNTNSLQAGVYFVKIQSSAGESVHKLIMAQ